VGGQQVHQQQDDQRVAAGKERAAGDARLDEREQQVEVDPGDERVEVGALHLPDPRVLLRGGAGEDDHHRHHEQGHREPQGGDGGEELLERGVQSGDSLAKRENDE
jgi:hypothetical protein